MGAVDLVIQVESPPSVASGLQRIGRAGHQVGEISQGVLFPKHRTDLIGCAVTVRRMLSGEIETMRVPTNPLDVLAQHTVAACALEPLDADLWFDAVRRSAPFATLPRSAFEATLDLLSAASTRRPSSPNCARGWCTTATRARSPHGRARSGWRSPPAARSPTAACSPSTWLPVRTPKSPRG